MSYVSHITIPIPVLQKNLKFSRKEHITVVGSFLIHINLPLLRANDVYVKIRNFGTFRTHGNRKKAHVKHMEKYNKTAWAKRKKVMDMSEKKLLF